MDTVDKSRLLSDAGRFDACGPRVCAVDVQKGIGGVVHAKAEHKTCRMFKTLMTNACAFDCRYCNNRAGCSKQVAQYRPEELASLFDHLHKKHAVNGLFLSSGVVGGDPDRAMLRMIESLRLIREKNHFAGYIHCKVLPGTSYSLIKEASELSSRLSVNIEAPSKQVMHELSSTKEFSSDILKRQFWIKRQRLSAGQSTQVILTDLATDRDTLRMMKWQYDTIRLKRMYYSAFRPVAGTPLEKSPAQPLQRQRHLYNVDFLFREYGFKIREFDAVMDGGMLPSVDPKLALARDFFRDGPCDLNDATYEELIRVPGIGPKTARRLVHKSVRFSSFAAVKEFGVDVRRAGPFVSVGGLKQSSLLQF